MSYTTAICISTATLLATFFVYKNDTLVKKCIDVVWSICRHWSRNIKSLLSLSLSRSEQSIFEEEFKYLIVTSSLFNETPKQQESNTTTSYNNNNKPKEELEQDTNFLIRLLSVSISAAVIFIFVFTKLNSFVSPSNPFLLGAYFVSCYFVYRHHRHVQIRRIHALALDSMHHIFALSQTSDVLVHKLLSHHSQDVGQQLCSHFETYIEFVLHLQPLIDAQNLSRLRDMYNVNDEIPVKLLEFESHQYTTEDIELIFSVVGWKRREYLLYLLALDVMSTNKKNTHYGKNWRQAIHVNTSLVKEYQRFNQKLIEIVDQMNTAETNVKTAEKSVSRKSSLGSITTMSDTRSLALMHRVSAVEKYIEEIQAKLFLCKQDGKSLSSGRERMGKRFSDIDQEMKNLSSQWESSKQALDILMHQDDAALLPSPPSSPRDLYFRDQEDDKEFVGFSTQLNRSQSCQINSTRPSSFSKHRLQRIQSLKVKNSNRD